MKSAVNRDAGLRIRCGRQPQLGFVENRKHLFAEIDFVLVEQVYVPIRNDPDNDAASHVFRDK